VAIQYQFEYDLLNLQPGDGWDKARANYRQLVNQCHPDRFAQRPRERAHAQQEFIELTKAFNTLRNFQRENNRMPFDRVTQASKDPVKPKPHQAVSPDEELWKPIAWSFAAVATIFAGFSVFLIMDRNAKKLSIQEAKRVLRTVEPSEYLADSEAITKANNRSMLMNGEIRYGK